MVLPDTFSRRKRQASPTSDPLNYDELPARVRQQALHILDEAIASQSRQSEDSTYKILTDFFRLELGVPSLNNQHYKEEEFKYWFLHTSNLDEALDAIEMICRIILFLGRESYREDKFEKFILQINARLLEKSIGYQFESRRLIKIDSNFHHKHLVVPALRLLGSPIYEAAEHEFLDAFTAFREGDYESTLIEACKSLESTIKVIGSRRHWKLDENWSLNKLIQAVFENNLIPIYLQTEFSGLRTMLESGIGTVRNKSGGHGAGEKRRDVPKHLAAFQLHQTAAAILLLVESDMASK